MKVTCTGAGGSPLRDFGALCRRHYSIAVLCIGALLAVSVFASPVHHGKVVAISDGDTFTLLSEGRLIKIRLAGIDAPERRQVFGNKARKSLAALAFNQRARVVEMDRESNGYIVGRVYIGRVDVNAEMVRKGNAWVYRKYVQDERLYHLEKKARTMKRGLWAGDRPVPPWEWRRRGNAGP